MIVSANQPVSMEEEINFLEEQIRERLWAARAAFADAKGVFDAFDADPEEKSGLWGRFNATERRLMKDIEGKEWS